MKKAIIFLIMFLILSIAVQASNWLEVASWNGSSIKNTEQFTIKAPQWRISWNTTGDGIFQIYVFNASGNLVSVAANVQGNNQDASMMYTKGTFYLQFNTTQSYSVKVEQKF